MNLLDLIDADVGRMRLVTACPSHQSYPPDRVQRQCAGAAAARERGQINRRDRGRIRTLESVRHERRAVRCLLSVRGARLQACEGAVVEEWTIGFREKVRTGGGCLVAWGPHSHAGKRASRREWAVRRLLPDVAHASRRAKERREPVGNGVTHDSRLRDSE